MPHNVILSKNVNRFKRQNLLIEFKFIAAFKHTCLPSHLLYSIQGRCILNLVEILNHVKVIYSSMFENRNPSRAHLTDLTSFKFTKIDGRI